MKIIIDYDNRNKNFFQIKIKIKNFKISFYDVDKFYA